MAEFKFSCPKCSQFIQYDDRYAGSQINCPVCQQSIVVPPPAQAAATAGGREIRIKVPKTRSLIIAGVCALLVVGIIVIVRYSMGGSTRTVWAEWSVLAGNKRQWEFKNGAIAGYSEAGGSLLGSKKYYGNVTFSATVHTPNREASLAVRMQNGHNGYLIIFAPAGTPPPWNPSGYIGLIKEEEGTETTLATYNDADRMAALGQTIKLTVIARGSSFEVQANGTKLFTVNDSTFPTGRLGLRIFGDGQYPCDGTFSKITFH